MSNNNNQINVPEAKEAMNHGVRKRSRRKPQAGLQRRPLFKRSRFRRWSDGKRHLPRTANRIQAYKPAESGANREGYIHLRDCGLMCEKAHG